MVDRKEQIKSKVDEVVLLLETSERECVETIADVKKIEATKALIEMQIVEAQKAVSVLNKQLASSSSELQSKRDEVEYLKNVYISKQQAVDANADKLNAQLVEVSTHLEESKAMKSASDIKFSEAVTRYNNALQIEKESYARMDVSAKSIRDANFEEREAKIEESNKDIDIRLAGLKTKEDIVKASINQELQIKSDNIVNEIRSKEVRENLLVEKKDIDARELALKAFSTEIDIRKQLVEYRELQVNKIIKEKNIADQLPK